MDDVNLAMKEIETISLKQQHKPRSFCCFGRTDPSLSTGGDTRSSSVLSVCFWNTFNTSGALIPHTDETTETLKHTRRFQKVQPLQTFFVQTESLAETDASSALYSKQTLITEKQLQTNIAAPQILT